MSYSPAFSQAIEILIFIEMKQREEFFQYLSIPKIAEGLNIPVPSVKRLVSMLKKANLITSKAGTTGGLALSQSIKEISFYDILVAIEGQGPLFQVYEGFDTSNFHNQEEVIPMITKGKEILQAVNDQMIEELRKKYLSDLF